MYNLMIPKNPNSIIFQDYKFRFFYNEEFINNHFKKLDDNQYALEWVDYINATINLNNVENFDDFSKIIVKGFDKTYLFTVMSIQFNSADKRNVTLRLELDMIFELSKIDNWAINGTVKYTTFKELTYGNGVVNKNSILNNEGIKVAKYHWYTYCFDTPITKYKIYKSIEGVSLSRFYDLTGNINVLRGNTMVQRKVSGTNTPFKNSDYGPFYLESYRSKNFFENHEELNSSDNIVKSYTCIIPTCFIAPSITWLYNFKVANSDTSAVLNDSKEHPINKYLSCMFVNKLGSKSKYTLFNNNWVDEAQVYGVFYNKGDNNLFQLKLGGGVASFKFTSDILMCWFNNYEKLMFCVLYQDGSIYGAEWEDAWVGDDNWQKRFKSKALQINNVFSRDDSKWTSLDWPTGSVYSAGMKAKDITTKLFYLSACRLLGKCDYLPIEVPTDYSSIGVTKDIFSDDEWFTTSNYKGRTKDAYGLIGLEYTITLGRYRIDDSHYLPSKTYYNYKIFCSEEFMEVYLSTFTCFQRLEGWSPFIYGVGDLKVRLNEFPSLQTNSNLRVQYYSNIDKPTQNFQWIELSSSLELRGNDWYNYLLSNSSQYQTAKSYADTQLKLTKQQAKWDTANSVFNGISNTISSIMGGALFSTMFGGSGVALGSVGAWSSVGSGITGIGSTVVSNKQKIASAQNAVNQLNAQQEDLSRTYSLDFQAVNYVNSRKQFSYREDIGYGDGINFITFGPNEQTVDVLKKHFFMYGWKIGMIYRVNKDLFTRDFEYLEMENCVFEETPVINQDAITKLLKDGIFVFNNKKDYNEITSLYQLNGWS